MLGITAAWPGGALRMALASLVVCLRMPVRSVAEAAAAAERDPRIAEAGPAVTNPVG